MRDTEQILRELRELAGAVHGFGVDDVGRKDFGVAVLAGVEVEHEVGESAFETRAQRPVDGEARAGEFGGAFEVEDAELLAEFPVRLGREIELGRSAPAAGFDVVGLTLADGHAVIRKIRKGCQNFAQAGVGVG